LRRGKILCRPFRALRKKSERRFAGLYIRAVQLDETLRPGETSPLRVTQPKGNL
jgi:hypothetical protein